MIDREKVIKGLECLAQKQAASPNPCRDCGYVGRVNFAYCVKDVAADALELLKEQEPVHIQKRELASMWFWCCGSCGVAITEGDKFCRMCGRAVQWG